MDGVAEFGVAAVTVTAEAGRQREFGVVSHIDCAVEGFHRIQRRFERMAGGAAAVVSVHVKIFPRADHTAVYVLGREGRALNLNAVGHGCHARSVCLVHFGDFFGGGADDFVFADDAGGGSGGSDGGAGDTQCARQHQRDSAQQSSSFHGISSLNDASGLFAILLIKL